MAKKGTKGSLLLQIGGAALTGYGIYLLFGKSKPEKTFIERRSQGGGGGSGAVSSSSAGGGYFPNVPQTVDDYTQGCIDPQAANYDPTATDYCPEPVYAAGNCFGQTSLLYQRQVCEEGVRGCTDPDAINYNPDATVDDGKCVYDVEGCTDPEATNYNPDATQDDGSCEFPPDDVFGCTDIDAINFDPSATVDDGSCEFEDPDVFGCTDPSADNYDPNATVDDGSCIVPIVGCTCPQSPVYNPDATVDNGGCKVCTIPYADNFIGDNCPGINLLPDPEQCIIGGCTNPNAVNYNPEATYNDGSCQLTDDGSGAALVASQPIINTQVSDPQKQVSRTQPATSLKIGFDGGFGSRMSGTSVEDARRRVRNGEFA